MNYTIDDGRSLVWKLPVYNTIHHILTNPIYAGAYAFGRTRSRVSIADGRKRVVRGFRQDRGDWEVLIIDHHDGYLSWAGFERNQRLIADNATSKGMMARGAVHAASPSSRVYCAAVIAGVSFTSLTAARPGKLGVIIAKALTSTMVAIDASPSAACASIRRSARRS